MRFVRLVCWRSADVCCTGDRDPASDNWSAKSHGRLDSLRFALIAALLFVFTLDTHFQSAALLIFLCLSAGVMVYSYATFLPYHKPGINDAHLAAALAYSWACFCAALLLIRAQPEVRAC